MIAKGVTLRGLEVFEALASSGSVAQTAKMTGLSQPAVSQQLSKLEHALATDLIEHNRRPMRLTPAHLMPAHLMPACLTPMRLTPVD